MRCGEILNNLPHKLNAICVNMYRIDSDVAKSLEGKLTNLPPTLEQIYIFYSSQECSKDQIKYIENNNGFNLLFDIKIPLNCDLIIKFGKCNYKIKYIDKNKIILECKTEMQEIFYKNNNIIISPRQPNFFGFNYNFNYQYEKNTMIPCCVTAYMNNFVIDLCGITKYKKSDNTINNKLLYASNK